jgi:hypothetical protein
MLASPVSYANVLGFAESELILFNASTLEVLRVLHFNSSSFTPPKADVFRADQLVRVADGRLFLTVGSYVYIRDSVTGAQIGFFSLPNYDSPLIGSSQHYYDYGYYPAQAPDQTLWFIDANQLSNGSYAAFHTTLTGTLLSQGVIDMGAVETDDLQSFAIASDGGLYFTV